VSAQVATLLHDALVSGDFAPLGEALTRGYGVPGLKAALQMLGFDHGDPRPPLPPLPARDRPTLHRLLEEAQLMPRALAS